VYCIHYGYDSGMFSMLLALVLVLYQVDLKR